MSKDKHDKQTVDWIDNFVTPPPEESNDSLYVDAQTEVFSEHQMIQLLKRLEESKDDVCITIPDSIQTDEDFVQWVRGYN